MATGSLRWGRIVGGGVLAECILIVLVIPMNMAGASQAAITKVAVAGSFLAFVPVAGWLGRSIARPVLHGVLMGLIAAVFYTVLAVVGRQFVADAPPTPFIYYVAHVLKLVGGGLGGWLAQRSVTGATSPTASVR
jgi:hypothetical protein